MELGELGQSSESCGVTYEKKQSNGRKAPSADGELDSRGRREFGRRSFLRGLGVAGATLLPASALLMSKGTQAADLIRSHRE